MKEFTYTITDPLGIHARPAGLFVKLATSFKSNVTIHKDEKEANAKRLFAVMGLNVKQGHLVTVKADGEDEQEACNALQQFLQEKL